MEYRKALRSALQVQIPIAVLCAMMLDGGRTAKICGMAMAGFWFGALLVAVRRPLPPSASDLWYWRYGFIPCFIFALSIAVAARRFFDL